MERFRTFAQGDIPPMEFWNEYLQDSLAEAFNRTTELQPHPGATVDAHGPVQRASEGYESPQFRSLAPALNLVVSPVLLGMGSETSGRMSTEGAFYSAAEDLLPHTFFAPLRLRTGDHITGLVLYGARTTGQITVHLIKRLFGGDGEIVAEVSCSTGTGAVQAGWTGNIVVTDDASYFFRVSINNGGSSAAFYLEGIKVAFNRIVR